MYKLHRLQSSKIDIEAINAIVRQYTLNRVSLNLVFLSDP